MNASRTTQHSHVSPPPTPAPPWRRISVALVGCGAVATQYYAPALRELERAGQVMVVALFDPAAERMAALRPLFTRAACVGDVNELGKWGAELAIVASPPRFHAEQSIQLLQAGCAVLCEKPLATSVAEGEAMLAAADASQRMLASGLVRRFFPAAQTLRSILAQQGLGAVRSFSWQEGDYFRWPTQSAAFFRRTAAQGGVLLDIGVHVLDLLTWWWGPPVEIVFEDDAMGGVEANCRLRLSFAQGHSGEVRLSRDWPLANRCTIQCEQGSLSWPLGEVDKVEIGFAGASYQLAGTAQPVATDDLSARLGQASASFEQSFVNQLLNVMAALQGGAELVASGAEALPSLRVIEHCYRRRQLMAMPWLSENERLQAQRLAAMAGG